MFLNGGACFDMDGLAKLVLFVQLLPCGGYSKITGGEATSEKEADFM